MISYIVQIYKNKDMWLAPWSGDPGRTYLIKSAKEYRSEKGAKIALARARRLRSLPDAEIVLITSD